MLKKIVEFVQVRTMNQGRYISYLKKKKSMIIGNGCEIYKDVNFGSEPYLISIGNNVRISAKSVFVTHDGGMWTLRKMGIAPDADKYGCIRIGDNTHVGMGVTIMGGVTIGKNCIIGCGAIVTKDVPDNSVAAGVPAHVIETVEEYYEKNKGKIEKTKHMNSDEKKKYLLEKYR